MQNPNTAIIKVKNVVAIDCILDPPGSEQMKVSCALLYNWQDVWFRSHGYTFIYSWLVLLAAHVGLYAAKGPLQLV